MVDPEFVRPAEPVPLVGDPSKAKAQLGWEPRTSFDQLVAAMVDHDLDELRAEGRVAQAAEASGEPAPWPTTSS